MNLTVAKLSALVQSLKQRILLMMSLCKIHRVDDKGMVKQLQVTCLPQETHDTVVSLAHYGLATHPKPGADALVLFPGGNRSQGIVVAIEDRRFRFKPLASGEVALYSV